jgi:hypothetical protein
MANGGITVVAGVVAPLRAVRETPSVPPTRCLQIESMLS